MSHDNDKNDLVAIDQYRKRFLIAIYSYRDRWRHVFPRNRPVNFWTCALTFGSIGRHLDTPTRAISLVFTDGIPVGSYHKTATNIHNVAPSYNVPGSC